MPTPDGDEPPLDDRRTTSHAADGRSRARRIVIAALGLMVAASLAGNALMPVLLRTSPVALLVVQSSYAQMALALTRVDPLTFVIVAGLRRWAGEVICFAGARILGADVSRYMVRRGGSPLAVPKGLDASLWWVRDLLALVGSNPLVAGALGLTAMPAWRFALLRLAGGLAFVEVLRRVITPARRVDSAATFVEANAVVLTVVAVVLVGGWWLRSRRSS